MQDKRGNKTSSILIIYTGRPRSLVNLYPDNGLANLAAALIKNGHTTKIVDFGTVETIRLMVPPIISLWLRQVYVHREKLWRKLWRNIQLFCIDQILGFFRKRFERKISHDILNIIKTENIDFVGFKLFTGNGFKGAVSISRRIKQSFPKVKIFAGGPGVDSARKYIYNFCECFDALSYGYGEETIVMLAEFVQGRRKLEEIPNLIFKKDGEIITTPQKWTKNLDDMPFPVYDENVYLSMRGNQKVKVIVLEDSRGCNNKCAFCYHPWKGGNFIRVKTAKRIVDEMEPMITKYGINSFRFAGSSPPPKLIESIADEIIGRGLKVSYFFMARTDFWNEERFRKIKRSGGLSILFGIESGSQYLLDKINKNYTVDLIKRAITSAKEAGIFAIGSFIFPLPFENKATLEETLTLIRELKFDSYIIYPPFIEPGSDWANNPEKYNIEIPINRVKCIKAWLYFDPINPAYLLPLVYKIDGKNVRQIFNERNDFVKILIKEGIFRRAGESDALLSYKVGLSPEELSHLLNPLFFSGDYVAISQILKRLNKSL